MTGPLSIWTEGVEQTRRAGELLGLLAQPDDVIALTGDLGAGKTALTQGIARGLGVPGPVPSPTFNILLMHRAPVPLFHFDLYRLERAGQLADIDFYETLESGGVSVIEWADRFPDELAPDRLDVHLQVAGPTRRILRPAGTGPRSRALADAWVRSWKEDTEGVTS